MVGITSYGAYIPLYRLDRSEIHKAWGGFAIPGEKAVINFDEDSVTMAVEAAIDCLAGSDPETVNGLFFATTTPPYKDKQAATIVATAADIRRQGRTIDFTDSLRAATIAMTSALDAVRAGSARSILVAAADCRLGAPQGMNEAMFGDGAAAILLGEDRVIASLVGSYSRSEEFLDVWRTAGDTFVRSWEDRFILSEGYNRVVRETVTELMAECRLEAKDFAKAVIYGPDPRSHGRAVAALGFAPAQVQDTLFLTVGNTGTALAPMMLVAALEEAKPGDRLLFASYGDGCDAFVLEVTDEIKRLRERRGIRKHLESKRMLQSYHKYVRWRELMPTEPPTRPDILPLSVPALWRDRKRGLALYGVKCKRCGTPQYPAQRICVICQAKDEFEEYKFADKKGHVFTFTQDNLAASIDPPITVIVLDFDDGGRMLCDLTDREPEEVDVGMPVEMTFRKLHTVKGIHNYWWKARPIRC